MTSSNLRLGAERRKPPKIVPDIPAPMGRTRPIYDWCVRYEDEYADEPSRVLDYGTARSLRSAWRKANRSARQFHREGY